MKKSPRAAYISSMLIFGTIGLFVRSIPVSSGELAFFRAVIAAAIIAVVLLAKRKLLPKEQGQSAHFKKELPLLLGSGAALGINWIALFEAYKYTSVSAATLSYYFAPVIVTAASTLLFKEKLTRKQVICFAMSAVGAALITGAGGLKGGREIIGIILGLTAAVFYAAVIIINKKIQTVQGLHRTLIQFIAAAIVLLPYVLAAGGFSCAALDAKGWALLITVGAVHTGAAYCLYFSSLKELTGQKAAVLSYLDPLTAVALSAVVLKEPLSPVQAIGGALILGFTLWNEMTLEKKA